MQNKKELNQLLGKHSEISVEKYILRMIRENKKLKIRQKEKKTTPVSQIKKDNF